LIFIEAPIFSIGAPVFFVNDLIISIDAPTFFIEAPVFSIGALMFFGLRYHSSS
jgi:hypothetical protein